MTATLRLRGLRVKIHNPSEEAMNTPAFNLPQPRSLLTITREDMEEAPMDWLESMRRKLAAQHGVAVEQVCFNQMSYADRAIYGEFRVCKAAPTPEVLP